MYSMRQSRFVRGRYIHKDMLGGWENEYEATKRRWKVREKPFFC